jgi:hypothetical protein
MAYDDNTLHRNLRKAWRKAQALVLLRGVGYLAACIVLMAFVDLALDWTLDLPATARAVLLVVNVAALAAILYVQVGRRLARFSAVREALREEAEHAGLESLLVSYLQLDEKTAPEGMSRDMIRSVRRRAEQCAKRLRFGEHLRFARLRRSLAAGGCAVCVLFAAVLLRPATFGALARRMLTPYAPCAYPTRTGLEAISGDVVVKRYAAVTAAVRASGEIPQTGTVHVRADNGDWQRMPTARKGADEFFRRFPSVSHSFDYFFEVGDAESPIHRVTAVPPPHIVKAAVRLKHPAYTAMPGERVGRLNLMGVPEGTVIEWALNLDRAVAGAELVPGDGNAVRARLEDGGRRLRASLTADASLSYRCRFRWLLNGQEHVDETAKHYIQVVPDVAPTVGILYPRHSGKATLSKKLEIAFTAADDYAISAARVLYALNDGKERAYDLDVTGGRFLERTVTLDPNSLVPDLQEGDILSYRIEADDNRAVAGGPQRRRSRGLRLQFVSDREYLQNLMDRRARYLGQLRPIYHQERQAYSELINLTTAARGRKGNEE